MNLDFLEKSEPIVINTRAPVCTSVQVESSVVYMLINQYVWFLFQDKERKVEDKKLRLEAIGYRIGRNVMERLEIDQLNKYADKLAKHIDHVTFLCTEFWKFIFGRQMDSIKTDYESTSVAIERMPRLLKEISSNDSESAKVYKDLILHLLVSILKGGLSKFYFDFEISCSLDETKSPPEYKFKIMVSK
eukprot:TRINITY_DN12134_c0_g1_i2.p1 TRINITY_DN12134_c0_g1~~TRINITY_DN12134_c0_g1_i2.p1  ORF type:complete len:189 (-),score=35.84 TRINITY_DN12134_c0_g1_i2:110-676(-)